MPWGDYEVKVKQTIIHVYLIRAQSFEHAVRRIEESDDPESIAKLVSESEWEPEVVR